MQNQNLANTTRREFLTKGAKMGVAQVILRWVYERGIISIVKTTKPTRMRENLGIFDFQLSSAEMAQIARLETGKTPARPPRPSAN